MIRETAWRLSARLERSGPRQFVSQLFSGHAGKHRRESQRGRFVRGGDAQNGDGAVGTTITNRFLPGAADRYGTWIPSARCRGWRRSVTALRTEYAASGYSRYRDERTANLGQASFCKSHTTRQALPGWCAVSDREKNPFEIVRWLCGAGKLRGVSRQPLH